MQEVVKKEIVKLLDTGIIYIIIDSPWVSPIQCVPKKGGITVVMNENDELLPTRAVTGWRIYLILSKTIVHTNHSALKHMIKKEEANPHLIRWTLLLQEFDIEIKDKKGIENVAANHLCEIDNNKTSDDSEIGDNFPGETLMEANTRDVFADFANYLVGDIIPKGMTYQQKNKFFSNSSTIFGKNPSFSKYVMTEATRALLKCGGVPPSYNSTLIINLKLLKHITLSPITPLDVQFNTPSPPSPFFSHPIPWNCLEAHGDSCLCCLYNRTLVFGLRDELQYMFSYIEHMLSRPPPPYLPPPP
uniref:Reverse transcriptase domain-containing protein n=1 Tax=Tanacetum cinerariifolium TaxID=118510 RepID=A0A6L2K5L8_TANCI|nr:reverse transcriptase domain-containing protein [Tanacetum cinerariifolium]